MSKANDLRGFDCSSLKSRGDARGEAGGAGGAPESEPDKSMNSRASWGVEGIDASVRERAEAAARRAGMSLSDWLNSTIGGANPPDFAGAPDRPALPSKKRQAAAKMVSPGN